MVRLRRTSPSMPGWTRVKHGRGFRYLDQDGAPLEEINITRCKELVIPPAWTTVWICPVENGHLQAVGTDDAGRRQYLYHPAWRERRDAEKFRHMEDFAAALLKRRRRAREEVTGEPTLRATAALAFCLLDLGVFRVGSDRYTDENGSYGLTTVERSHVRRSGDTLVFSYVAKSGQDLEVGLRDARLVDALERLRRRRTGGDVLLAHRTDDGWTPLGATAVNEYVKELLGDVYSAKDFRTWRGTVIAASTLSQADASTKTARARSVSAAMRVVADHLGNTPAVARSSYVDPRVVDLFHDGVVVAGGHRDVAPGEPVSRSLEEHVLELLGKA